MIGRLVRPADFERVLAAPSRSRSAHFAVHHVAGVPGLARAHRGPADAAPLVPSFSPELSTDFGEPGLSTVDESGRWLGLVVPKRHARRAVTRNLLKRQVRASMQRLADALPAGLWVVRLKAPFDRQIFASPGSQALREAARQELGELLERAARAPAGAPRRA